MSNQSRNKAVLKLTSQAIAILALGSSSLFLASCDSNDSRRGFSPSEYGVAASQRVVELGQPVPRGGGTYRVGKPYQVHGIWYEPAHMPGYRAKGTASWYGDDFHGRKTANGEIYNMYALTAAHPTLPMPSYVRVTNVNNGRSLVVRINDRGPYHSNRVIDLSKRAANLLGVNGLGNVELSYLDKKAPLDGHDDAWLMAQIQENGRPMPASKIASIAPVPAWAMVDPDAQNPVRAALADVLPPDAEQVASLRGPNIVTASADVPGSGEEIGIEAARLNGNPRQTAGSQPAFMASAEGQPALSNQLVQVGVYRDVAEAVRYRNRLSQYGPSRIEVSKTQGETLYQVNLGPFADMAAARIALKGAQEQGAAGAQLIRM